MTLLAAEKLSVNYAGNRALANVSMRIERGEIVTLVGPNGSGKSTLIKALLGVLPPSAGSVIREEGLTIGYVPQSLAIDTSLPMTVARFMSLPVRHSRKAIAEALQQTGVPDLSRRQMTALSGGQFQRVLLARALLSKPDILVLDEPTQGLDQPGVADFYRLIEDVRTQTGCAVLMVSHDLHVVMSATDRVICLNGHVCCEGEPNAVVATPEYRELFGEGALAFYRHQHDHRHDHVAGHRH